MSVTIKVCGFDCKFETQDDLERDGVMVRLKGPEQMCAAGFVPNRAGRTTGDVKAELVEQLKRHAARLKPFADACHAELWGQP